MFYLFILYTVYLHIFHNRINTFPALKRQHGHFTEITCSISKCSTKRTGEVSGPGLSYCSIPGSHDAVEPAAGGVNGGVSQSVYMV